MGLNGFNCLILFVSEIMFPGSDLRGILYRIINHSYRARYTRENAAKGDSEIVFVTVSFFGEIPDVIFKFHRL